MNIFKKIWDLFQPIKENNMPDDDNILPLVNEANGEAVIEPQLTKVVNTDNGTISNTNEESFLESLPEIKRTIFFDTIRTTLFAGHLTESKVKGIRAILNEWDKRGLKDLRWLAYCFATVHHECDKKFEPIEEYGRGKGHSYGLPDPETHEIYFGRGFIQLTHRFNYETFSKLLHVDLVNNPHLALDLNIATQIMFEGMIKGLFTGRKLSDYFNDEKTDWFNARRIINRIDRAKDIEGYAKQFYAAL